MRGTDGQGGWGRVRLTPTTPDLSVEVVTTVGGLQALAADYERLLRATGNALPFRSSRMACGLVQRVPRIRQGHSNSADDSRCTQHRRPVCRHRAVDSDPPRRGGVKIGTLDLLGSDPAITEIRTSIIDPSYETRAVWRSGESWQMWEKLIGSTGRGQRSHALALSICADLKIQRPLLNYVLDLPPSWDQFHSHLKRNIASRSGIAIIRSSVMVSPTSCGSHRTPPK